MKIDVCFAIHDKSGGYTKYLATAIYSVLKNTETKVVIHVICDETLPDDYKNRLVAIVEKFNAEIHFYNIGELKFDLDEAKYKRLTIGTLYRLKLMDMLPKEIDKVIQLDVDIVANMNLGELYLVNLEDKYLAAVVDRTPSRKSIVESGELPKDEYINVGIVVWDLKKIREEGIDLFNESIKFFDNHPNVRIPDEEAVNIIFRDKIKYLSCDYNFPSVESRRNETEVGRKVYHFCADVPRDFDIYAVDRLFIDTFEETGWYCKKDFLLHYTKRIRNLEDKRKNAIRLFNALDEAKRIIVWGVKGDIHQPIMDIINREKKDYVYVDIDKALWGTRHQGEIVKSPEFLREYQRDVLIISTVFRYSEVCEELIKYGYKENVDFFDGKNVLEEEIMAKLWGERHNPWDI